MVRQRRHQWTSKIGRQFLVGLLVGLVIWPSGCASLHPDGDNLAPPPDGLPTERSVTPVAHTSAAGHGDSQLTRAVAIKKTDGERQSTLPPPRPVEPNKEQTAAPAPSVLPPPVAEMPVDLPGAWLLAGIENPTIALAREAINEALARQLAASVLLVPTANAGFNYHLHRGNLQASPGIIRTLNEDSLYAGGGARTLAAETVAFPMVRLFAHLGDAIYEPMAAQYQVATRSFDAQATENQILLEVTLAYFDLIGAGTRREAIEESAREFQEIVRLTSNFARTGQGRRGDADRAEAQRKLIQGMQERIEEDEAVAAARLARLLSLDPSVRLKIPPGDLPALELVSLATPDEDLVRTALVTRPEAAAAISALAEARTRTRQEATRPLFPVLSIGYSTGGFGGGSNLVANGFPSPGGFTQGPRFGRFSGRQDFDVFAVWTLQNLGLGNLALYRRNRSVEHQVEFDQVRTLDQIRREVLDALADARAAREQIGVARQRVSSATDGYREDLNRAKGLLGYPIELLDSARRLAEARQELIGVIVRYNQAQFRLFVAMGESPLTGGPDGASPCVSTGTLSSGR